MPNTPQTVSMFYAANMVGAIANMIHPLSSENEIAFYLNDSDSKVAITLDQFYPKFEAIKAKTGLKKADNSIGRRCAQPRYEAWL